MKPPTNIRRYRRGTVKSTPGVVAWLSALVCLAVGSFAPSALASQAPTAAQLLSGSVLTWEAAPVAASPPPLVNATAVYDSDNQTVVLFGGRTASGALSDDTWVWNGSRWTDFAGSRIEAPPARQEAAMAFDPTLHQLILFGGEGSTGQLLDDTWAWNGLSWYLIGAPLTSTPPPPLAGASMAYDASGNLVMFGGTTLSTSTAPGPTTTAPTTSTTTASTTTVPPAAPATTQAPLTGADSPSSSTPSTVAVPSTEATQGMVNSSETWLWTVAGWTQEAASGPPARTAASMVYDSTTHQTLLFGGQTNPLTSGDEKLLGDTWLWNGASWVQAKPKTSPPDRSAAAIADDPSLAAAWLYGGVGVTTDLADMWLWSGTTWLSAKAAETPAGRDGSAAIYDDAEDALVLFGGSISGILSDSTDLLSATLASSGSTTSPTSSSHSGSVTPTTKPGGTTVTSPTTLAVVGPAPVVITAPLHNPLATTSHQLRPGSSVTLFGSGFVPGTVVTITFHSTPQMIGTARADANGQFSATVTVPDGAKSGHHHLEASGMTPSGSVEVLTAAVVISGSPLSIPTPTSETVLLVAASLAIPLGAWVAMSGAGWLRRRSARSQT